MRRNLIPTAALFAAIAMSAAARDAGAQKPSTAASVPTDKRETEAQPPEGGDPFMRFFFPIELIMQHQGEIGLSDAQRSTITTAVQQAQGKFVEIQFKLSGDGEKLARLLQGATVDEAPVLEQVDRILASEREMKRAQIALLIRLKNALTPQQQTMLKVVSKLTQLRQARP